VLLTTNKMWDIRRLGRPGLGPCWSDRWCMFTSSTCYGYAL